MTRIEYLKNVIRQSPIVVTGFGVTRSPESPSRDAINVTETSQLLSEIIEHMSRVTGTSKQDDVPSRSTPVQEFQPNSIIHRHRLYRMGRRITPR